MQKPPRNRVPTWATRLAWLIALWTASVAALAVVAGVLRLAMHAAGLSA
ncbi:DUF2474 family protein (plasmid) [Mycetohabitans rhizoxinica]|jgi:hypothetical protein|nr:MULTISPECIES: DUF2474 family protein [Mycetohabitans]MCF7696930.1 DUF2474 family protein [Mycetohabitans sp. B2]MCG1048468.1 DUF2474 family protein [Mycetohabitans sp. B6]